MLKLLRRPVKSVFTRLLLIMLLMTMSLGAILFHMHFGAHMEGETALSRSLLRYVTYLADDIGFPPDRQRAAQLAAELEMHISVEGGDSWEVGMQPDAGPESDENRHEWRLSDTVLASSYHGRHRIRVSLPDGGGITFDFLRTPEEEERFKKSFVSGMVLIGVVLLVTWLLIRRQLKPLRRLAEGAARIRDGEMGYRVRESGCCELADLSKTFNQMAGNVEMTLEGQRRLLLDVGHELRTPITRMKLQLEMTEDAETAEALAADLCEMETLVTSLLESSRLRHSANALARSDTDVAGLAEQVALRFEGVGPGIVVELGESPLVVNVDPGKIATVFSNLLDNALKYSTSGSGAVMLEVRREDDEVVIEVRDHGMGIPEQDIPRLFEPFYRVDQSRTRDTGGFGLGLSLCRDIVQAHGGVIGLQSVLGKGTTVTVRLPHNLG